MVIPLSDLSTMRLEMEPYDDNGIKYDVEGTSLFKVVSIDVKNEKFVDHHAKSYKFLESLRESGTPYIRQYPFGSNFRLECNDLDEFSWEVMEDRFLGEKRYKCFDCNRVLIAQYSILKFN